MENVFSQYRPWRFLRPSKFFAKCFIFIRKVGTMSELTALRNYKFASGFH